MGTTLAEMESLEVSLLSVVWFAIAITLIAVSVLVATRRIRGRDLRERQDRLLALAEAERLSRLDLDGPEARALLQASEARIQGWVQERGPQRGAVRESLLLLVAGGLTLVAAIGLVAHGVERLLVLYG